MEFKHNLKDYLDTKRSLAGTVMKNFTFLLSLFTYFIFWGCSNNVTNKESNDNSFNSNNDSLLQIEKRIKGIEYLSVDSVYRTLKEKQKFDSLKRHFLSIWLSDSNCYRGRSRLQKAELEAAKKHLKEVDIGNILHSPDYDTLLVLVSWYVIDTLYDTPQRTYAIGMGIIKDANNEWRFRCDGGTSWIETFGGNFCKIEIAWLKEKILNLSYLRKDRSVDITFWRRLYQEHN
jgi:hypothetical protein